MKILLIEDEKALATTIQKYLIGEGYICEWVSNLIEAEDKIGVYEYDCILVDIMLPNGSGLSIVEQLKAQQSPAGIIIISAKNALDDKIKGLDLGADDYLTKPFHLSELNSRVKSVLRRRHFGGNREIIFGEIKIIPDSKEVWVADKNIVLTRKEYDLLMYLIANQNRVLTKSSISEHLYGDEIDQSDTFDFLYSHIKNLRKKMLEASCPDYIQTLYGVGYKFSLI
ncbi:response regulator transcription factor [Emticicia sp. TH156]|uniref:response regulator transcription factor n=1 Tax=Emticicia sp. TH156 TaxID=2067454 RepID=UPI000C76C80D|nr:response regulator transcription factor [Emticicia sp. TH156]PLK44940.1 DNA-binding response regulator [Emticicia sp. TH156]